MSVSRIQTALSKTGSSAMGMLSKTATVAEGQYNTVMQRNAQYVVKDAQQESVLLQQWIFTKLAKLPGVLRGASTEAGELGSVWAKRGDWTVRDVAMGAFFGVEVYAWFCVGEILGRGGTLTGYYF